MPSAPELRILSVENKKELPTTSSLFINYLIPDRSQSKMVSESGPLFRLLLLATLLLCLTGKSWGQNEGGFEYRSYQTGIFCSPSAPIQEPRSIAEIQAIVKRAIATGQTVKAIGSRHSLTDCICTDGIPISMKGIAYTIDNQDGTARFGAGIEMADALEFLEERGLSLIHVPTYGGISVGGAIGTGAHGSSLLHLPSVSDQVVELTVIDGLGNLRIINDTEQLKAWRVHLGLLGIVVDVTLQTVPLFKMRVENRIEAQSLLFNETRLLEEARSHDLYQLFWFPSYNEVVASRGVYVNASTLGNAWTNFISDGSPLTTPPLRATIELNQASRSISGQMALERIRQLTLVQNVVMQPPIFTENGITVKNPAVGYAWRLLSNKCTPCHWDFDDSQSIIVDEAALAFDLSEFPRVVNMLRETLTLHPTSFHLVGILIRFIKGSDALMAINSGRDSFTVEWAFPLRNDRYNDAKYPLGTLQAILQALLVEHGGRPHWGKNGLYYSSPEVVEMAVPNRKAFLSAMETSDPHGIFLNKFGRRIRGEKRPDGGSIMDVDPLVTRCALQDYCICSSSLDCADGQICSNEINGFNACLDGTGIPGNNDVLTDLIDV